MQYLHSHLFDSHPYDNANDVLERKIDGRDDDYNDVLDDGDDDDDDDNDVLDGRDPPQWDKFEGTRK